MRDGGLYFPEKAPTRIEKRYTPTARGFDFEITLTTEAEGEFRYILEHNFHFADYEGVTVNKEPLAESGTYLKQSVLEIGDAHLEQSIVIRFEHPCDIHYFTLKTLSQSESGFDLSIQGISFAMEVPFAQRLCLKGSLEVEDV